MFKTTAFFCDKPWGYEKWIVSAHKDGMATIDKDTDIIGEKPLSIALGAHFPLLVKIIQADETLSVQVHPQDPSESKSEAMYILEATANARLICGLKKDYTKNEIKQALLNNNFLPYLVETPVAQGDLVYIPTGTVHAIGEGTRILEIGEAHNTTYRLYDWGRNREMHITESLNVLTSNVAECQKQFSGQFACEHFVLQKLDYSTTGKICLVKEPINTTDFGDNFIPPMAKQGWGALFVINGEGTLVSKTGELCTVKKDDCIMIGFDEEIRVEPASGTTLSLMKIR